MFLFGFVCGTLFGFLATVFYDGKKKSIDHKQHIKKALRRPRSRKHFKGY